MDNFNSLVLAVLPVLLPIGFGYAFRHLNLFSKSETVTLRKFVIRVSVPFIIFKNLYLADIASIKQFLPNGTAFVIMTAIFTLAALTLAGYSSKDPAQQKSFMYSVFVGNYSYLGWGVLFTFYGNQEFTRAVFFTIFFWPMFLFCGFWMMNRKNRHSESDKINFFAILKNNASIPLATAALAIALNLTKIEVPQFGMKFITQFSGITIPMILFTIGLNFKLRIKKEHLKPVILSSATRLGGGIVVGLATLWIVKQLFTVDIATTRVILLESVMPTAAMAPFFGDFTEIDQELIAGIIGFSTLLSLISLPFWFLVLQSWI